MRILAWNANYNNRRRTFLENVSITEHLHADIVILSETALPLDEKSASVQLIGCNAPGLAILAKNGFELKPYVTNEDAPSLVGGWTVSRTAMRQFRLFDADRDTTSTTALPRNISFPRRTLVYCVPEYGQH